MPREDSIIDKKRKIDNIIYEKKDRYNMRRKTDIIYERG